MLAATLTQLILTVIGKVKFIAAGQFTPANPAWGNWFQLLFAGAMAILAIVLVVEGVRTFSRQIKKN